MRWKNLFVILAFVAVLLPCSIQAQEPTVEWVRNDVTAPSGGADVLAVDPSGNVYVTGAGYRTVKYDTDGNRVWFNENYIDSYGRAFDIAVDSSGNVYVSGASGTIKLDANGNEVWIKSYRAKDRNLAIDPSDNVYIVDTIARTVVKLDTNGDVVWFNEYANTDFWPSVITVDPTDPSGIAYVAGRTIVGNYSDLTTKKHLADGQEDWFSTYDIDPYDSAYGIALDSSGNVYVAGNMFLAIKYDSNGFLQWFNSYADGQMDWQDLIALDPSGNVYLNGETRDPDGLTVKFDTGTGNIEWVNTYDADGSHDYGSAITVDSSGNVYVTGTSKVRGTFDYATKKYDTNGNLVWVIGYDGGDYDWPSSIKLDPSGNVYVTGWSYTPTDVAFLTIKYSQGPQTPAEVVPIVEEMLATGEITSNGVANAIITKLNEAQAFLDAGDTVSARTVLEETIDLIEAQRGNHITSAAADELIGYINNIIAGL